MPCHAKGSDTMVPWSGHHGLLMALTPLSLLMALTPLSLLCGYHSQMALTPWFLACHVEVFSFVKTSVNKLGEDWRSSLQLAALWSKPLSLFVTPNQSLSLRPPAVQYQNSATSACKAFISPYKNPKRFPYFIFFRCALSNSPPPNLPPRGGGIKPLFPLSSSLLKAPLHEAALISSD